MSNLYAELRGKIIASGMTTARLAYLVGVTSQTINNILGGRTQPRLDLCYEILEQLGEPPERLPLYFPPGGIRAAEPVRQSTARGVIRIGAKNATRSKQEVV
jgi:DNA-binding XRE family transcriptional regulator